MNTPPTTAFAKRTTRLLTLSLAAVAAISLATFAGAQPAQTPTPDQATATDQQAGEESTTSLFEAFFIQKNPRTGRIEWLGSAIVWLLLAASATSLALIGVFAWENRRANVAPIGVLAEARDLLAGGNRDAVLRMTRGDRSYAAKILGASLREADFGRDAMLRALERACEEHTADRLRRVEILNVIGGVAPMVGLFGTVYGMILAFREIVAAGGSPDPVGLAAGIGTALTTTFWGLVVAIPALAGYALIRNTIDSLTSEATLEAEDMLNRYQPAPDEG